MKRAASLVVVFGAAAIAACFTKPDAPHLHGDGGVDAKEFKDAKEYKDAKEWMDAPPSNCGSAHDDFNTAASTACGDWASSYGNVSRGGGVLTVQPNIMGGSGACQTKTPFKWEAGGAQVEIPMPLISAMGQHSFFKVMAGGNALQFVQIDIMNQGANVFVNPSCSGTAAITGQMYNNTTHRWWRFSPKPGDATTVLVDSGSDGTTWTPFAGMTECMWGSAVTTVDALFGAGLGSAIGASGTFDNFNVRPCPSP